MMNCPSCGTVMVWLNGSVLHDTPVKYYQCRLCRINVTKYEDGTFETTPLDETGLGEEQKEAAQ